MVDIYLKLAELKAAGKDAVLVTVTEKEGNSPTDVGKKMIVTNDEFIGTIGGGSIEHFAIEKAKQVLLDRTSFSEKYVLMDKDIKVDVDETKINMACGGKATLFYEFVGPKEFVYIFGAGHCGKHIAKLLSEMNYFVTVIDNREELLQEVKKYANCVVNSGFAEFFEDNNIKENSYLVVATPSHIYDYDVLDVIIEKKLKIAYFGMLCSRKKIHDYLLRIKDKYGDVDLSNFYSPIGLDLGGDSPEEVAISVVSEIQAFHYKKSDINSHMRNKVAAEDKYF